MSYGSAAASGWSGWALAHPEFGSSVNPITTRGADYAHHITACPPGFENPAAALHMQNWTFYSGTSETSLFKITLITVSQTGWRDELRSLEAARGCIPSSGQSIDYIFDFHWALFGYQMGLGSSLRSHDISTISSRILFAYVFIL